MAKKLHIKSFFVYKKNEVRIENLCGIKIILKVNTIFTHFLFWKVKLKILYEIYLPYIKTFALPFLKEI